MPSSDFNRVLAVGWRTGSLCSRVGSWWSKGRTRRWWRLAACIRRCFSCKRHGIDRSSPPQGSADGHDERRRRWQAQQRGQYRLQWCFGRDRTPRRLRSLREAELPPTPRGDAEAADDLGDEEKAQRPALNDGCFDGQTIAECLTINGGRSRVVGGAASALGGGPPIICSNRSLDRRRWRPYHSKHHTSL